MAIVGPARHGRPVEHEEELGPAAALARAVPIRMRRAPRVLGDAFAPRSHGDALDGNAMEPDQKGSHHRAATDAVRNGDSRRCAEADVRLDDAHGLGMALHRLAHSADAQPRVWHVRLLALVTVHHRAAEFEANLRRVIRRIHGTERCEGSFECLVQRKHLQRHVADEERLEASARSALGPKRFVVARGGSPQTMVSLARSRAAS